MAAEVEKKLQADNHKLLFAIRLSGRYHDHRRRFYELWNTFTVATVTLLSSVAATILMGKLSPEWISIAIAGSASILGILDLAVSTARRAVDHTDLSRRFTRLEERFAGGDLNTKELGEATRERLAIEASEPPALDLLRVFCHLELRVAYGYPEQMPKMPWYRRALMHFLNQTQYAHSLRPQN